MKFSNNSKIDKIVNNKLESGWYYHKGKKHHVLVAPNNRRVTIPSSSSCRCTLQNFVYNLQGIERI